MPLYLAHHTVEQVTAKVSLTMIMLADNVKKNTLPPDLRCRAILPTSSEVSISLWDAPSEEHLLAWLNDNLQYDSVHTVSEVQEEFSWGLTSVLATSRAADKVAASSRGALNTISATASKAGGNIKQGLEALDQKTNIISRIKSVGISSSATAAGQAPAPGAGAETNEASQGSTLASSVSTGLSKASSTFSWLGQSIKDGIATATQAAKSAASSTSTSTSGAAGITRTPTLAPGQQPADVHAARPHIPPKPMPVLPPPAYQYDSGAPKGAATNATAKPATAAGQEEDTLDSLLTLDQLHQLPVSVPPATTPLGPTATDAPTSTQDPSVPPPSKPTFTLDEDDEPEAAKV